MVILPAVRMAHALLKSKVETASRLIDATAGNGNDTLFLARFSPAMARVQAFDIQQRALDITAQTLAGEGLLEKVTLIRDSHSRMRHYNEEPVDVVMFNLGYLPGGQHGLTTLTETSLEAVAEAAALLRPGGIATVVAYPGHPEGQKEYEALKAMLRELPQTIYNVAAWQMVNQINRPPILLLIERKKM